MSFGGSGADKRLGWSCLYPMLDALDKYKNGPFLRRLQFHRNRKPKCSRVISSLVHHSNQQQGTVLKVQSPPKLPALPLSRTRQKTERATAKKNQKSSGLFPSLSSLTRSHYLSFLRYLSYFSSLSPSSSSGHTKTVRRHQLDAR